MLDFFIIIINIDENKWLLLLQLNIKSLYLNIIKSK